MKSFAVIGLGRFGRAVARQLFEMGNEVLVVDKTMDNSGWDRKSPDSARIQRSCI